MNHISYSNGRIVEQVIDHGDGTGTRTTYDADGNVTGTEQVTRLPVESAPEKNRRTVEDRLRSDLDAMQQIIDTPNASMDTTALRRAVKDQARALRRLIRHALDAYDDAD